MSLSSASTTETIIELATRFVAHVKQRFDLEIDYTENTLSLLDHFISEVVSEEGGGAMLPPGHAKRAHLVHLLAPTMGAYFGQVLCRVFPCQWAAPSEDPMEWLIRFDGVPLWLNPAGACAEAIVREPIESWNGSISTSIEENDALLERLQAAPPVSEDEFFAVANRFEVLQISYEWLLARKANEFK